MIDQSSISLNNNFSVKVVSRIDDLANLRDDWDKLASKHGSYMPFLCFDWFQLWIEHFLDNNELLVLLLYEHGDLQTIAPLLIKQQRFKGIPVRKIELIGNVYSPVRSLILDALSDEKRKNYISSLFSYLFSNHNAWDVIDLFPISQHDKNIDILKEVIREKRYRNIQECYSQNWYMDSISYSGDEYIKSRPSKMRSEMKRKRRKLAGLGNVQFKIVKNDHHIDKYMNYYYEVYAKSWKKREGLGPTFHRDLSKLAGSKGWLRLGLLLLNDIPVASQFCIVCDNVAFFLKTAYDEHYRAYGPGVIVIASMIKHLIDEDNVREIDFGHGDESYKKYWVSSKRELKRILVFNNNLRGQCLDIVDNRIRPAVKKYRYLRKAREIIKKCVQ